MSDWVHFSVSRQTVPTPVDPSPTATVASYLGRAVIAVTVTQLKTAKLPILVQPPLGWTLLICACVVGAIFGALLYHLVRFMRQCLQQAILAG